MKQSSSYFLNNIQYENICILIFTRPTILDNRSYQGRTKVRTIMSGLPLFYETFGCFYRKSLKHDGSGAPLLVRGNPRFATAYKDASAFFLCLSPFVFILANFFNTLKVFYFVNHFTSLSVQVRTDRSGWIVCLSVLTVASDIESSLVSL